MQVTQTEFVKAVLQSPFWRDPANAPFVLGFSAQTLSGHTLSSVYWNPEVYADWLDYMADLRGWEPMTYEQWVGIEPLPSDHRLVWC